MKRLLGYLLVTAIFNIANNAQAAPGATPGEGGVSSTGAAQYSIPIRVPAGINGVQPNISLQYHSRAGNQLAGKGWSIAGIPQIERCGQIHAIDGKQTGIRLNTGDRFCLDGQRLVRGTGTYGANGATYYTEIESFAKVTSYTSGGEGSAPGSGPKWFKVETPDGLVYEYGKTADSRLETAGTTVPLVWAVNRITDPDGNYIEFTYLEYTDKGMHYPREIHYTGTASSAPIYSIYFTWPLRPAAERTTHYIAGSSQRIERRLGSIQLRHNGSEFRRYALSYESSTSPSGLSRLSSVQECAGSSCLPATSIDWQSLDSGIGVPGAGKVTNKLLGARLMDVDGDGRKDLVYASGGTWRIRFASNLPGAGINFASAVNTGRSVVNESTAQSMDFDGDGRDDLLYLGTDNRWRVLRSNGSGFKSALNTGVQSNYHGDTVWISDIDGDGRGDLIYARETIEQEELPGGCKEPGVPCYYYTGYVEIFYRLNTGSSFGNEVKARQINGKSISPVEFPDYWRYKGTSVMPDFNGDGISDLMVLLSPINQPGCTNCDDPSLWTWHPMTVKTGSFPAVGGLGSVPHNLTPLAMDINGDGNSDIAYADPDTNKWRVHVSNGNSFSTTITTNVPRNAYGDKAVAFDYNDDGRDDLVLPDSGYWKVGLSTGVNLQSLTSVGVPWQVNQFARIGDFDADGDGDMLMLRPWGSDLYWRRGRNKGEFGDMVISVHDGLDNEVRFSYGSSADANLHEAYEDTEPPSIMRMRYPYALVDELQRSDGNGGINSFDYRYVEGRRNREGRGFLGFARMFITDSRDGSYVEKVYRNTFPYLGVNSSTYQRDASGQSLQVTNVTWNHTSSSFSNQGVRLYVESKRERRWETSGGIIHDFTTGYSGYDIWGNPANITYQHTSNPTSFPAVTISNSYDNSIASRRCPGRVTGSTVTNSAPGEANVTETTAADWDAAKCRINWQEREPASATHRVRTAYGYDVHGNVDSVTTSGAGVASRQVQHTYDPLGYRQTQTSNALGHAATVNWDPTLRRVTSTSDINGNLTSYDYDGFDRVTRVTRADGSYADINLANCSTNCAGGTRKLTITETLHQSGGSVGGSRSRYLDSRGRVRLLEQQLMYGLVSKQQVDYDAWGRVASRSMPFTGSSPVAAATYSYDVLDRPELITLPGEGGGANRSISYEYARVSATTGEHYARITDPEGKVTTRYFDTLGRPTRVRDALSNDIHYEYDAAGRLTKTIDPDNNTVTIGYDILGNRISLNDPDLGSWSFVHNAYGELLSQTDAASQVTTYDYDAIGRLIERTDPDGTSEWVYDTASGAGIGKLHQVTGPDGYVQEMTYDSLGRPIQQDLTFDASSYQYDFSYDAFSRLSRITYPVSVSTSQGNRFAVDYTYNSAGVLTEVSNANDSAEIFWQATDMNAFGHVTTAILGNDVTSIREFDPYTGRLKTLRSHEQGQPEMWNLHYEYSQSGNVTARENSVASLREDFTYDALYRLKTHSLNGTQQQAVDYDAIGNITSKTGTGTYSYTGTRPHAVTATSTGSITYAYDDNGNMTDRGATSIDWNAANLPVEIETGSDTLTFKYGPTRQRYKQVANIGGQGITTHYIGSLMEAIGGNGVVQYRHRIMAAGEVVAQHSRDSNVSGGNPQTKYFQRDMLGSIGLITDESANVIGEMHFDPWGKRIDAADWDGDEQATDIAALRNITHRGFTDHEMLDGMNLVHMNGRVYDPNIGRMLSADPINSEPFNLQRYNRYSYVNNQPLKLSDPSGYEPKRHASDHLFGANVYTICATDSCAQQMGGAAGYMGSAVVASGGVEAHAVASRMGITLRVNYSSNGSSGQRYDFLDTGTATACRSCGPSGEVIDLPGYTASGSRIQMMSTESIRAQLLLDGSIRSLNWRARGGSRARSNHDSRRGATFGVGLGLSALAVLFENEIGGEASFAFAVSWDDGLDFGLIVARGTADTDALGLQYNVSVDGFVQMNPSGLTDLEGEGLAYNLSLGPVSAVGFSDDNGNLGGTFGLGASFGYLGFSVTNTTTTVYSARRGITDLMCLVGDC